MPYAQISDVRGLIPHVPINAESQPSEGTIAQWIADVERVLNVTLSNIGFQTPVTGPNAIAVLKLKVAHVIAAMVLRSRPNPETDPEKFQSQYDSFLKALTDPRNPLDLPSDAIRIEATVVKDTGRILRTSSQLTDILDEDTFRMRRDQVF